VFSIDGLQLSLGVRLSLGIVLQLQKVAFGAPYRLGPFDPDTPFPGRMDDTPALEAWIRTLMEAPR
jgi:hypothetical protein